ncbi:hypothetical protein ACPV52_17100 [Vibrio astriarenae]
MNLDLIEQVRAYHQDTFGEHIETAPLKAIIAQWPALSRGLSHQIKNEDLAPIRLLIRRQLTKAKRESHQRAFQHLLIYLSERGLYQLPKMEAHLVKSQQTRWLERVYSQSGRCYELNQWYQACKARFLKTRETPSFAFVALAFSLEVAPVSLTHLTRLLAKREVHRPAKTECEPTLSITLIHHRKLDTEEALRYRTRYALTPFVYCLLESVPTTRLSETQLLKQINLKLEDTSLFFQSPCDYKAVTECLWVSQYALPSTLLLDLSTPERHVSPYAHLKQPTMILPELKTTPPSEKWPHESSLYPLMRQEPNLNLLREKVRARKPSPLHDTNIVVYFLDKYTQALILDGGPVKPNLSHTTIYRYTSLKKHLIDYPLAYHDALEEDTLNQWAQTVYKALPTGDVQSHMRKFFYFLAEQSLTEQLDLSHFVIPTRPPSVNAFCIKPNEFAFVLVDLLTQANTSWTERLLRAVGAILSFHGMLRRGEILRLRLKDILSSNKLDGQYFELIVRETDEGGTKSGKPRWVSICLPAEQARLVHRLLKLKKGEPNTQPLIALPNESLSIRANRYLLPISESLKARFGQGVVFHHLRHSGARVLYEQLLRLAYERLITRSDEYDDHAFLLQTDTVHIRFHYWLEKFEFSSLNGSALFDVLGSQIGHALYATTRFSYLHDIDWLPEILFGDERAYSHSELRYLFGLSPNSNDIARLIKNLNLCVYSQSLTERRRDPVKLSQKAVIAAMLKYKPNDTVPGYREPLEHLWEYSQAPEGFYHHCELSCVLDSQHRLSYQTLSALLKCSPQHRDKSLKPVATTAFDDIDMKGLNETKPYFTLRAYTKSQIQALAALVTSTELGAFSIKLTHHLNKSHRSLPKECLKESQRLFGKLKLGHYISDTRLRKSKSHIALTCYHPWITDEKCSQQACQEMKSLATLLHTYGQ